MFELKPLSHEGVPAALEKAMRYRVLNEPWEAESICRDILRVEPERQDALATMVLALTDQFAKGLAGRLDEARKLSARLESEYERAYYRGIILEREAKIQLRQATMGCGPMVYDRLRRAMEWFEKAEELQPEGNEDALLRWNACARLINDHPEIAPEPDVGPQPPLMLE